jgi:hypothetical protein
MPKVKRVPGGDPGRARRTLLHYVATCRGCGALPSGPREAHVHAVTEGHSITETRHYVVEPPE